MEYRLSKCHKTGGRSGACCNLIEFEHLKSKMESHGFQDLVRKYLKPLSYYAGSFVVLQLLQLINRIQNISGTPSYPLLMLMITSMFLYSKYSLPLFFRFILYCQRIWIQIVFEQQLIDIVILNLFLFLKFLLVWYQSHISVCMHKLWYIVDVLLL